MNIGYNKNSSWNLFGFPNSSNSVLIASGQQYNTSKYLISGEEKRRYTERQEGLLINNITLIYTNILPPEQRQKRPRGTKIKLSYITVYNTRYIYLVSDSSISFAESRSIVACTININSQH